MNFVFSLKSLSLTILMKFAAHLIHSLPYNTSYVNIQLAPRKKAILESMLHKEGQQ